ncbi:MAG: MetQ/NlpA family ABC transporter substrate-binding protein [Oscillospiraceae bacterium]|nr:MetQ/NlpA family ABC transporter substrate-binding protein [Oscillospiraceae bacterium]
MKKTLTLVLTLVLVAALLAGCGSKSSSPAPAAATAAPAATEAPAPEAAAVKLRIAATPVPHAEILEIAKTLLAEQGIELEIVIYTDYVQPNLVVDSGELDANYFQHTPYMDSFNAENGTNIVSAGLIHYEPFGVFAGKTASIADLPDGAKISIPNDATNGARALLLLQQEGVITLKEGVGIEATKYDIVDNPKNVELVEMEAAQLPLSLSDVDLAVINGNYALDAGLNPATDALAIEDASGDAAQYFANLVGVKAGNENSEAIKALVAALQSQEVKDFINSTYDGAVVPIF